MSQDTCMSRRGSGVWHTKYQYKAYTNDLIVIFRVSKVILRIWVSNSCNELYRVSGWGCLQIKFWQFHWVWNVIYGRVTCLVCVYQVLNEHQGSFRVLNRSWFCWTWCNSFWTSHSRDWGPRQRSSLCDLHICGTLIRIRGGLLLYTLHSRRVE